MYKPMLAVALLLVFVHGIAKDSGSTTEAIPTELKQFIAPQTKLLALEAADPNGDGLQDYIFVLENAVSEHPSSDEEEGQRVLKIAIRRPDNSLKLAKTNDKAVYCATCGGAFGDPFNGITASSKTFSIHHYGGSGWRWANTSQFNYSRRDDTWQLVMVKDVSFHASNPEKQEVKIYRPPKNFGKIDISEFDPENFKGVGER